MTPPRSALGRRQALAAVWVSVALGFALSALHLAQDARQEAERMARVAEGVLALVEAPAARAACTYDQALSETVVRALIGLGSVTRAALSDNLGRTLAAAEAPPAEVPLRAGLSGIPCAGGAADHQAIARVKRSPKMTASLGRRVDLASAPGAGTTVTIRLPPAVGAAAA